MVGTHRKEALNRGLSLAKQVMRTLTEYIQVGRAAGGRGSRWAGQQVGRAAGGQGSRWAGHPAISQPIVLFAVVIRSMLNSVRLCGVLDDGVVQCVLLCCVGPLPWQPAGPGSQPTVGRHPWLPQAVCLPAVEAGQGGAVRDGARGLWGR